MKDITRPKLFIVGHDLSYYPPFAPLFSLAHTIEEADVAMFTGGEDVTPKIYGDVNNGLSRNNPERDVRELEVYNKLRSRNVPLIGICRGSQFITAASGGKLYQDVSGHGLGVPGHRIVTRDGRFFPMSSTHHQMMRPAGRYELLAWTEHLSKSYITGKGVVQPELKVDPEIVFYPGIKALCIQGHPEYLDVDCATNEYVRELVKEFIL